jgi:hypothetical protein
MAEAAAVIGLSASIVQLIQATAQAYEYVKDIKNAPEEWTDLGLRAANLVPLLTDLRERVQNADPNDPWIKGLLELGGPTGHLEQFKTTMDKIHRMLEPAAGWKRTGKRLTWKMEKNDIKDLFVKIEGFKSTLLIALSKDLM